MAGSSFGGVVKLSGESEYRKALNNIVSNLRVMSSEMQIVTATYGKNDKSVEGLTAKNQVLNKQIEEQAKKVETLQQALESAQKETGNTSSTTQKWQVELNKATAQLVSMQKEVKDNEEAMKSSDSATQDNSDSIKKFGENAKDSGNKVLSLGDMIKANLISSAITNGLKGLVNVMGSVLSSVNNLIDSTKEYSSDLSRLEQNANSSNVSFSAMKYQLSELEALTGETDSSIEGLSNLMATGFNTDQIVDAVDSLSGAIIKFPDTLKIESLSDSLQETIATGSATGQFSELIERMGYSLDDFNAGLEKCTTSTERQEYALKWLSESGLKKVNSQYQEANSNSLNLAKSQAEVTKAQSSLAKGLTDIVGGPMADINYGLSAFISYFNDILKVLQSGDTEKAAEMITENILGLVDTISEIIPDVLSTAGEIASALFSGIADALPSILSLGSDLLTNLLNGISVAMPNMIPVILNIISTLINTLISNLPTIVNSGIQILVSLIQGISQSIPELVPTFVEAVITIVNTLLDNLDQLVDAGIQIILALIDGIIESLPTLIDKMPEIIDKLIVAITNNLPKLIQAGITLTLKLAEGLIQAVPQLVAKLPQIITAIVNGLASGVSQMAEVGLNLVKGLWEGISGSLNWIKDKIKSWVGNVFNFIKKLFGINSPSKLFRDEIGINLAKGIGVGFSDEMDTVNKEIMNAIPTNYDVGVNTTLHSDLTSPLNNDVTSSQSESFAIAVKDALKGMHVVLDGDKIGELVVNTVEDVIYT